MSTVFSGLQNRHLNHGTLVIGTGFGFDSQPLRPERTIVFSEKSVKKQKRA
jgi:hypothetical protein